MLAPNPLNGGRTAITSASILPTAEYNGKKYYYFGLLDRGRLTTFGGTLKKNEKRQAGAVREFDEESLGVFGSVRKISEILSSFRKTMVARIENPQYGHVLYITPIKLEHHNKNPIKLFEHRRSQPGLRPCQKEIKKIIAISEDNIAEAIKANDYKGMRFRMCALETLRMAQL